MLQTLTTILFSASALMAVSLMIAMLRADRVTIAAALGIGERKPAMLAQRTVRRLPARRAAIVQVRLDALRRAA